MSDQGDLFGELEEKEKYGGIKTLTVLTFIGCGFAFLVSLLSFLFADFLLRMTEEAMNSGKTPMNTDNLEALRVNAANRVPIFITSFICTGLCLFGAIQMRKLKKDGYWLWLIGELLPLFATGFFIGFGYFKGLQGIASIAVVALFVILYSVQLKHLTK